MQTGGNPQIARINKWTEIDRTGRLIGAQESLDRSVDGLFAELRQQQTGALAETAGVAVRPEQQDLVRIRRIGDRPHPAKRTGAVVQRMGRDREGGLRERHTLATEPGVGQELMHGVGGGGHSCRRSSHCPVP